MIGHVVGLALCFEYEQDLKRTNLNFAVAYVILVALPLLGLAGVLRRGRTLAAPVSVGGLWRIQASADHQVISACARSLALANASFTISQSGKNFIISFANSRISPASGTIEGTAIRARIVSVAEWAHEGGCNEGHSLMLTATVDSNIHPQFLAGMLSFANCEACAPVQFRGVREDEAKRTGR